MKRTIVEVNHEAPSYSRRSSHKKSSKPSNSGSRNTKKKNKKDKKEKKQQSVTIKSGDTLSEIAERNHTTVKKLKKLNGIKGNGIRSGKKIRIK
jgi:membrane-bound lytic murein transglycosylase D